MVPEPAVATLGVAIVVVVPTSLLAAELEPLVLLEQAVAATTNTMRGSVRRGVDEAVIVKAPPGNLVARSEPAAVVGWLLVLRMA